MITEKHTSAWEELLTLGDGLIPAGRLEYLKKHLQECKECRMQLESLERTTTTPHKGDGEEIQVHGAEITPERMQSPKVPVSRFNIRGLTLSRLRPYLVMSGLLVIFVLALLLWNFSLDHLASLEGTRQVAPRPAATSKSVLTSLEEGAGAQQLSPATQTLGPMIARSISLSIVTKDFAEARASLEAILGRHKSYAADLAVNTEQNSPRSLQASLRIPAGELAAALAELKSLGTVEAESQKGEEVTQQRSDLVARLKNSRETEQRLQAILQQRTGKMSDVLEVEQEISRVRGEIEGMEVEQNALEHRVYFATVDLHLAEEYRAQLGSPSLSNRFRNALVSGFQSAADTIVAMLLFLLNYGPTLLLWVVLLIFPARFAWRRWGPVMRRDLI